MRLLRLTLVVTSLCLGACVSLAPPAARIPATAERLISGRISVQYKESGADRPENLHGRFDWVQSKDQIELSLLDPLGQSVALIRSNALNEAVNNPTSSLMLRDGRSFTGSTPEDLSEQALGWRLPLRGLAYWLDGQARPGTGAPASDAQSGGTRLSQDGWTIVYPALAPGSLPRRLDLNYPGPPVEVELKLIIDERSGTP